MYFSFALVPTKLNSPVLGGWVMVLGFLSGATLYLYRFVVPVSGSLCALCLVLALVTLSIKGGAAFAPIPIAYATVCLGLTNPAHHPVISSGDYSYGIYLYGFQVQQAVIALTPLPAKWYVNLAIAVPITGLLAMTSWFLVEKPLRKLRPRLYRARGPCARAQRKYSCITGGVG